MSDSDPKDDRASTPSEPVEAENVSPSESSESPESPESPERPSRETLIGQAWKFLEQDEIRNADTDKKVAFLEQKGLERDEIKELLGVTRNFEASNPNPDPSEEQRPFPRSEPPTQPQPQFQPSQSSQPPIITYPEFLTVPSSDSPLITRSRLLTTLYVFSGLSALLYGTNNYLVTPMITSLTESRLSLAETTKTNLQRLIEKLEGVVSTLPPPTTKSVIGLREKGDGEESEDEDPSELFHRDIGVQTSLPASPTLKPADAAQDDNSPAKRIEKQSTTLSNIHKSLDSLLESSASDGHDAAELEGTIGVLREYLDGMAYAPAATYSGIYGSGYGSGLGGASGRGEADDEIAKVKSSIRGVKGVLLSARSFPGGVRAGAR